MTLRNFALVAVILASIALAVTLRKPPCDPQTGDLPQHVRATCGAPDSEHVASGELGSQVEWLYGDTVVGFFDGTVAYVLR